LPINATYKARTHTAHKEIKAEVIAPELLDEYLDPQYQYDFWQNPDLVRTREDALQGGINCVSLAHLVLKDMFEHELPPRLGCAELYLDREYFKPVDGIHDMRAGDLVWFGLRDALRQPEEVQLQYDEAGNLVNWRDFPVKHVAVNTGYEVDGDPLLLHATNKEGRHNKVWPLSKFGEYRRYQKLYGVTRLALQS